MIVREVREALTPRSKLYTHLDLCYETSVLGGDDTIGSRHLQGVWRKVKRGKLSWCPQEDHHLWERIHVDGAPTEMYQRILIHGFHLEIHFEDSLIFNKMKKQMGITLTGSTQLQTASAPRVPPLTSRRKVS